MVKLSLSSFFVLINVNVFSEENDDIAFIVQPKICVLAAFETHCKDKVELSWTSARQRNLCIYQHSESYALAERNPNYIGENNQPLKCWVNAIKGVYEIDIETKHSIEFYLKDVESEMLLASQAFKVIHDTQRYRRRHRNPWSFF